MTPSEYFDAAKKRLNVTSDYALCKKLGVPNNNMPGMRSGKRAIPVDVMFKLAITLELDPATVIADLESQREKNAGRCEFWKGFISRAALVAITVACTLAWSFSGMQGNGLEKRGGFFRRYGFA